jgi:hypothetical protein
MVRDLATSASLVLGFAFYVFRSLIPGPEFLVVEEGLEDKGCGDLVDDAAVLLSRLPGLVEDLVGFAGGKALVPQVDGQACEGAKLGGEGLVFFGLGAEVAGEVDGVANHDGCHAKRRQRRAIERRSSREMLGAGRRRSRVRTGWAVRPSSSETATPMRRLPMSRAR